MKALILAGGRGSRLTELTKNSNKSMLKLLEKPLIEYNLDQAVELGVKEIIIVVGYKKENIMKHVGNEYEGIKVRYVIQKEQRGLVNAIEVSREALEKDDFILMLADEIVVNARMKEMLQVFKKENLFALCGIVHEQDKSSIGKTYSAMVNEKGRVFRLIEKPRFPINPIKGTGHCILKNEMLSYIERTPVNANRGERELVDWIQVAVDEGKKVYVHKISDDYVNVNTQEDFELAKEIKIKSNPKILIVHPQMKFIGGAELLIIELANWLTKMGVKNDILTFLSSQETEKSLINTRVIIPENNISIGSAGFNSINDILEFIKICRKELKKIEKNYDVINFHNFPSTWTLFPRKKASVWMLNEPPNLWSRPNAGVLLRFLNKMRNYLDKKIVQRINVICVADEFNRQRAFERYSRKSRVVYYGVNYDFFSRGNAKKARSKFNLQNKFIVLQSGMLTEQKNQMESLRTISKIKNKIPNILLILAGQADESYKKALENYIIKNKIEKHVLFTGNLKRDELRDLYKASNLGLFPVGKQGGWLAPFEMLCSQVPVIVSEEMGASGLIKKHELGLVTGNYSESILEVHKNYTKYKKMAIKASKFVRKNLSWKRFTEKMISAYRDALRD